MEPEPDAVAVLRRWEDAGGLWRVLARQGSGVTVGLFRCDGGEEIDRLVADDPRLSDFLAGRSTRDEPPCSGPPAAGPGPGPGRPGPPGAAP